MQLEWNGAADSGLGTISPSSTVLSSWNKAVALLSKLGVALALAGASFFIATTIPDRP